MDLKETNIVLNKFAKYVIQQSRSNLTKGNKNYQKKLYDSLKSEVDVFPNSFGLSFIMENYGVFQDRGVKGTEGGKSLDGFSYKKSSNLKGFEYHTGTFAKWAKFRGMQPRDKKGRFGSYKTMGFILADSIKKNGLKPSLFFTKPFEAAFKKLPDDLVEGFGLDIDKFLQSTIKENIKK